MKPTTFVSLLCLLGLQLFGASANLIKRAGLQQVTNFGSNPSNTLMYIYVPAKLAAKPPVVVAIHYCTGTAQAYYTGSPYAQLAEQYGFIVIFPQSPYSGTCWDVSSKSALSHNGGGDSNSIANMVTYTISTYKTDASRVFVTGSSSGAMMTNVMCATYPDMFAAASVYSGVPAGCFVSSANQVDAWNSSCAQGLVNDTPQQWANVVHAMYPGYTGGYPPIQVYHGSVDTTLLPPNYNETVDEWIGVNGYSTMPAQTLPNTPLPNYTKYVYGPKLQGIYAVGVGHTVPIQGNEDMKWFGIVGGVIGGGGGSTVPAPAPSSSAPAPAPSNPAPSSGSCAALYGQCGGSGWTGATCCSSGTCKVSSVYYSQCL